MGKNAPPQHSESGVKDLITNYELQITNLKRCVCFGLIWCVFWVMAAQNSFAQIETPNPAIPPLESIQLEYFSKIIKSGTTEQKRDALYQIRNLKSAAASRAALPALKDSAEIVRATAVTSVVFLLPDEAVQTLSPLLNDKKDLVRREAAYALGETRSPLAVSRLIEKFQKEKVGDVKNACVVALGMIGDVSAISFLTQILQKPPKRGDDADEFLRRSTARSIGQIAEVQQTGNFQILTPQNLLIGNTKLKPVAPHKNLADNSADFRQAVSILIGILQNPNETEDTKRETAFALGAIADNSAKTVLQSNLNAPDYYLARICEESLAKISSVTIAPPVQTAQ